MDSVEDLVSTARRASESDLDAILETVTLAFANDPVWRPSLDTGPMTLDTMREIWRIHLVLPAGQIVTGMWREPRA